MLTTPDGIVFISLEVLIFWRLKVRANKEIKLKDWDTEEEGDRGGKEYFLSS